MMKIINIFGLGFIMLNVLMFSSFIITIIIPEVWKITLGFACYFMCCILEEAYPEAYKLNFRFNKYHKDRKEVK